MNSNASQRSAVLPLWTALILTIASHLAAYAQPTIVSTVPAHNAANVSPSANVVFTFNTPMNPELTSAMFMDVSNPIAQLNTIESWSAGNTVLTCTPSPAFPASKTILWSVDGESAEGEPLEDGSNFGLFNTGSGGTSSGWGTNSITTFSLGKTHAYVQTSAASPTLDPDLPYNFAALTSLASNRTATGVTLTLPSGAVSNLFQNFVQPENFTLFAIYTNLADLDTTFTSGSYSFRVQATSSNQVVPLNFPANLAQPGAPHISNFAAAQNVNATQPFVLTWDPFPGGTASDFIIVSIGDSFASTNLGEPGALRGTATSVTIPANTFPANTTEDGTLAFYRYVGATNGTSYRTLVYRATVTQFTLKTGSGVSSPLVLTNASWVGGTLRFDVLCSAGQTVTVDYRTNLAVGAWQTLLTTNSPGDRFQVTAPASPASARFFRARNGL